MKISARTEMIILSMKLNDYNTTWLKGSIWTEVNEIL